MKFCECGCGVLGFGIALFGRRCVGDSPTVDRVR